MHTSTLDSGVKEVTVRGVKFPVMPLDNGRGFKVLTEKISIGGSTVKLSKGLPRKLAKKVKRQPSFGLNTAKDVTRGNIIIEFDKPVGQMSDDCLEQHVFLPMARKIRRSHQAALPTEDSKGRRGLSQPALAQASS